MSASCIEGFCHSVTTQSPVTDADVERMRELDALIQFRGGRYAGVPGKQIPPAIVRRALEEFDPGRPIRFNPQHRNGGDHRLHWQGARPSCPKCYGVPVRRGAQPNGTMRWECRACGIVFRSRG